MSNLKLFENTKVRSVWNETEEKWYFSIQDVLLILTGSSDIKQYIKKLKSRDPELSRNWGTICTPVEMVTIDGKKRKIQAANVENLLRIIQSVPSPKAEPFKRWLAKVGSERLEEIENPEIASERIREIYNQKGYSKEWIEKRMRGIAVRDELTEEWKKRGVKENKEFSILTAEISKATFGMTPSEYKSFKELNKPNDNLRDHLPHPNVSVIEEQVVRTPLSIAYAALAMERGNIKKVLQVMRSWGEVILLLSTLPLSALEPIRITEPEGKIVLGLHTEYMEDKDGKLRFGDIRKMDTDHNDCKDAINHVSTTNKPCWNKSEQKNLNFGFTTSAYWIKFQIQNEQDEYKNWLLEISYPFLDRIDLFSPEANGNYTVETTGDTFPFSNRKIPNRHFILKVPLYENQVNTYYLRIESKGGTNSYPAILYSPIKLIEKEHSETIALGIFYGVLVALFLYNMFLFISLKDISYFYYLSYLFCQTIFFLSINGFGQEYIWPNWIWFNGKVFPLFGGITIACMLLFMSNYLSTKTTTPILHKILFVLLGANVLAVLCVFIIPYEISIKITFLSEVFLVILVIGIVFRTLLRVRAAKYFALAWASLILGGFLFGLKSIAFLPENFITNFSFQIGSALEMILLSIGLGDKINILKEEKLQTQKDSIEEQKKLITSYARFVPEQLLTFLGKDIITKVGLGDSVQKDMTILFSDIRSFTSISETLSPSENFGFINSYLETMGPIIRKHNGFIDKYIGDAIMALFPQKPSDAIDASIEMLEELYKLNVKRKSKGFAPISIGIGIHTGSQMLGIIGEKERMEGTVISDVVNTASRLEGLTKAYSTALLISEDVLEGVADKSKYEYRFLDTVKVKGKNKAVRILEILNGVSPRIRELKLQTKPDFEEGIRLYFKKNFKSSLKKMNSVLKKDSKDKAAELYIERCNFYSKNGTHPNWDGIEKLDFK